MSAGVERGSHPGGRALVALGWGVAGAAAMVLLQWRLHYVGQPQSFDSMVYARGLWGLGHGELQNPVVGVPVFAVHGHLHLALLAPLTRVVPSLVVLIGLQAAAFGATLGLVAAACGRGWASGRAALLGGAALMVGSPLAVNPFLFGLHPGVAGVPVVLWALLRAHRQGRLGRGALVALAIASCMREEWALVGAAAVLAWPVGRARRVLGWRNAVVAACFAGYWVVYAVAIAKAVPGDWLVSGEAPGGQATLERLAHFVRGFAPGGADWARRMGWRLESLAAAAATLGGGALLGRRGWIVALPGLALVLGADALAATVAASHYPMFAAPGLVLAGIEGWERARRWVEARGVGWRRGAVVAVVLVGMGAFAMTSALPGGGRYREEHFLLGSPFAWPPLRPLHNAGLEEARALTAEVPASGGVATEYVVAEGLVDRRVVWAIPRLHEWLREGRTLPEEVGWVLVARSRWDGLGRRLVTQRGFRLVGLVRTMALLSRVEGAAPLVPPEASTRCDQARAVWPEAGLALCEVVASSSGEPRLRVCRGGAGRTGETWVLMIGGGGADGRGEAGDGAWAPADGLGGLFNLRDLGIGECVWLEAGLGQGSGGEAREAALVDGAGSAVGARVRSSSGADQEVARVPLR